MVGAFMEPGATGTCLTFLLHSRRCAQSCSYNKTPATSLLPGRSQADLAADAGDPHQTNGKRRVVAERAERVGAPRVRRALLHHALDRSGNIVAELEKLTPVEGPSPRQTDNVL